MVFNLFFCGRNRLRPYFAFDTLFSDATGCVPTLMDTMDCDPTFSWLFFGRNRLRPYFYGLNSSDTRLCIPTKMGIKVN